LESLSQIFFNLELRLFRLKLFMCKNISLLSYLDSFGVNQVLVTAIFCPFLAELNGAYRDQQVCDKNVSLKVCSREFV